MSIHKQLVRDLAEKQILKVISGCIILFFILQGTTPNRFLNTLN